MNRTKLAALLLAAATTTGLMAAPFQNGSFEIGTLANTGNFDILGAGSTAITGWTVVGDGVDYIESWVASNGIRSIDMLSCGISAGVQQTFDTVPGSTYKVTFDLAGNPDGGVKTLSVTAGSASANYTFDTTGANATNMNWVTRSLSFTANSTSSTLTMLGGVLGGGGSCAGSVIDNVTVALERPVIVPVGGGFGAALLVIAGVVALRRRQRV